MYFILFIFCKKIKRWSPWIVINCLCVKYDIFQYAEVYAKCTEIIFVGSAVLNAIFILLKREVFHLISSQFRPQRGQQIQDMCLCHLGQEVTIHYQVYKSVQLALSPKGKAFPFVRCKSQMLILLPYLLGW